MQGCLTMKSGMEPFKHVCLRSMHMRAYVSCRLAAGRVALVRQTPTRMQVPRPPHGMQGDTPHGQPHHRSSSRWLAGWHTCRYFLHCRGCGWSRSGRGLGGLGVSHGGPRGSGGGRGAGASAARGAVAVWVCRAGRPVAREWFKARKGGG